METSSRGLAAPANNSRRPINCQWMLVNWFFHLLFLFVGRAGKFSGLRFDIGNWEIRWEFIDFFVVVDCSSWGKIHKRDLLHAWRASSCLKKSTADAQLFIRYLPRPLQGIFQGDNFTIQFSLSCHLTTWYSPFFPHSVSTTARKGW